MNRLEPREINRKFARTPTPTSVTLEITNRCNHECIHCVRESPTLTFDDELSTDEWLKVLDDLAAINTFSVAFTGGEAMTHPDLFILIKRARELSMSVSIKTNGMTLRPRAQQLYDSGVRIIEVSLYGATSKTHEHCTGVPRSFELTLDGIRAAREANISVMINMILFKWNVHEFDHVRELAQELGCSMQRNYLLTTTDLGRHLQEEMCTPHQIREIENQWPMFTMPSNQNGSGRTGLPIKICTQGINRLAITARGEILSCITIRKPLGHVRHDGIQTVWKESAGTAHNVDYSRLARCSTCAYLPKCNVCLGHNNSATGTFYEPPLERCYSTMALYGASSS